MHLCCDKAFVCLTAFAKDICLGVIRKCALYQTTSLNLKQTWLYLTGNGSYQRSKVGMGKR